MASVERTAPRRIGRYALHDVIASGGMATVHFGRLAGPGGFTRTVAIKRLHPHLASDEEFVAMFLDEARLSARIRHPNVVPTFDVLNEEGELFVVMEYVHGESLARLLKAARRDSSPPSLAVVSAIIGGTLHGLHAAHEAKNDKGEPLSIVHRDVSPQNVLVGVDGVAHVLDFGIAKAKGRLHTTQDNRVKGKFAYMAPEQLRGEPVDRRTDVYAAGVVLWEMLTGRRLFVGDTDGETAVLVLERPVDPPSHFATHVPKAIDDVVMRAIARDPSARFDNAKQMALAVESAVGFASPTQVADWVESIVGDDLRRRGETLARIEGEQPMGTAPAMPASEAMVSAVVEQPSVLSVTRAERPKTRKSRRIWPYLIAIVLGVGGGATLGWRAMKERQARESTATSTSAHPSTELATSSTTPTSSATTTSTTPDGPSTMASATTSPPPAATIAVKTAPTSKMAKPAAPPVASSKPTAAAVQCQPPYTIVDGVRRYKPECPLE